MDYRKIWVIIVLSLFASVGIGLSLWLGQTMRTTAIAEWENKGRTDARRLTDSVLFWISKAEVNLRAIAGQLQGHEDINTDSFFAYISEAESWDPEVTFDSVAYARRFLKNERKTFEKENNVTFSTVMAPQEPSPSTYESFAVVLTSNDGHVLRPLTDIISHPALKTVAVTARQLPGHVVLGPSFANKDGKQYALIGTYASLMGTSGVMVATLNLADFFSQLESDYIPPGINVRLVERDNEASAMASVIPVIGSIAPPGNAEFTETIRITSGQAKWDLHWDILPEYLGGPDIISADLIQYGGPALSIILAALFGFLSFQTIRFHHEVDERTAELSQNSMIVQLTMDSIDQGFAVWNSDQRLVVWSKRCKTFWYDPPKNILRVGMHMRELLEHIAKKGVFGENADESIIKRELNRIVTAGVSSEDNFEMTDGHRIHVRRFPLERGGLVAVYTDVTEREKANEALNRSNKELLEEKNRAETANRAKTEFLAHMSHELRTPLNSIIGFAEAIAGGHLGEEIDNYKEYAGLIHKSGKHLHQIVHNILDLSKIESESFELQESNVKVVDLFDQVHSLLGETAEKKGLKLVLGPIPDNMPSFKADETRVRQVLINLVGNAIKYSEEGTVKLEAFTNGGAVRISVRDEGVGIPFDDLPTITEPFIQSRTNSQHSHEGTGLGLTIASRIMAAHGGSLDIESQVDIGTVVTIRFPKERCL